MAELKVSEDKRILTELKLELVNLGNQGLKCCVLVADYMAIWPHKTDHKYVIADLVKELGVGESRINQMWRAGRVGKELSKKNWKILQNESHLLPLAPLLKRDDKTIDEVVTRAVEIAGDAGEPLKAEHVKEAADERRPISTVTAPVWTPEGPIRSCILRLKEINDKMKVGSMMHNAVVEATRLLELSLDN